MRVKARIKLMSELFPDKACQRCGYNTCVDALHFHHLDSSEKREWSKNGHASPNEIRAHPERFQLVCANCHYEIHADQHAANIVYGPCLFCGNPMPINQTRVADGRDKYCSKTCQYNDRPRIASESIEARFWQYVKKSDSCWRWTGATLGNGHAVMSITINRKPKVILARRLSYELHHGPIPEGKRIATTCRDLLCVNPAHLEIEGVSRNGYADRDTSLMT